MRYPSKDFDSILNALDWTEVGEMDEQALIRLSKARPHFRDEFRLANVNVAIDEIADDLDFTGYTECLPGAVAQVTGDAGDSIGAHNSKTGNWKIGRIKTDKRYVCSVKRGDDGKIAALVSKHLLREQC